MTIDIAAILRASDNELYQHRAEAIAGQLGDINTLDDLYNARGRQILGGSVDIFALVAHLENAIKHPPAAPKPSRKAAKSANKEVTTDAN